MTNINCAKPCQFQSEGKCCCDSVLLPEGTETANDPDCPYLAPIDKAEKKQNVVCKK